MTMPKKKSKEQKQKEFIEILKRENRLLESRYNELETKCREKSEQHKKQIEFYVSQNIELKKKIGILKELYNHVEVRK